MKKLWTVSSWTSTNDIVCLYLFAFVYHLLDDALNPLKLGTHARAGTDGCNCLIQGSRLIGIRHLPFPDCLFPLLRPIKLELQAVRPESRATGENPVWKNVLPFHNGHCNCSELPCPPLAQQSHPRPSFHLTKIVVEGLC
jgi:hypothetical protein